MVIEYQRGGNLEEDLVGNRDEYFRDVVCQSWEVNREMVGVGNVERSERVVVVDRDD